MELVENRGAVTDSQCRLNPMIPMKWPGHKRTRSLYVQCILSLVYTRISRLDGYRMESCIEELVLTSLLGINRKDLPALTLLA